MIYGGLMSDSSESKSSRPEESTGSVDKTGDFALNIPPPFSVPSRTVELRVAKAENRENRGFHMAVRSAVWTAFVYFTVTTSLSVIILRNYRDKLISIAAASRVPVSSNASISAAVVSSK